MLSRKLVPALTSLVVVSGVLTFLSCDIDAKQEKPVKMAKSRPSKCCAPGYIFCPTGGEKGCDCCGASVKGTLTSYQQKQGNKEGTGELTIAGLVDENGKDEKVPFVVENTNVDKLLPTMLNKPGQFILKLKPYQYDVDQSPFPRNNPKLKHWHGTHFECENVDDKGQMKDRTAEFIEGWKTSGTVLQVRAKLEELVPQYDPERDEDKR